MYYDFFPDNAGVDVDHEGPVAIIAPVEGVHDPPVKVLVPIRGEDLEDGGAGHRVLGHRPVVRGGGEHRLVIVYINYHNLNVGSVGHTRDTIVMSGYCNRGDVKIE